MCTKKIILGIVLFILMIMLDLNILYIIGLEMLYIICIYSVKNDAKFMGGSSNSRQFSGHYSGRSNGHISLPNLDLINDSEYY